ncbi:hypothetical protein TNCV_1573981 [Trichonephila clavipes]|nr:hypothetical protein TNCV_1573981 [Trichonephila clavipes]
MSETSIASAEACVQHYSVFVFVPTRGARYRADEADGGERQGDKLSANNNPLSLSTQVTMGNLDGKKSKLFREGFV